MAPHLNISVAAHLHGPWEQCTCFDGPGCSRGPAVSSPTSCDLAVLLPQVIEKRKEQAEAQREEAEREEERKRVQAAREQELLEEKRRREEAARREKERLERELEEQEMEEARQLLEQTRKKKGGAVVRSTTAMTGGGREKSNCAGSGATTAVGSCVTDNIKYTLLICCVTVLVVHTCNIGSQVIKQFGLSHQHHPQACTGPILRQISVVYNLALAMSVCWLIRRRTGRSLTASN